MKKMKKLASILLAAIMVLAMAVPAMATSAGEYSITIEDNGAGNLVAGHNYEAYQVFTGRLEKLDGENTLSDIDWGTGVDGSALLTELKTKSAFEKCEDAADVAYVVAGFGNDSSEAKKFAEIVSKHLSTVAASTGKIAGGQTTATISGLSAGYYLVKDADDSLNNEDLAYTEFILQVVDNVTISPKADVPSVTKKVKEKNDTTGDTTGWQDAADYDIDDMVPFKLEGTLPSNYDAYTTYEYQFNDTLSTGLTLSEETANLKVYIGDEETGSEVAAEYYEVTIEGQNLTIKFADLKKTDAVAGSKITVVYEAKLNDSAVIGSGGNPNTVNLTFSNNPNGTGTGKTPDDTVKVFTFKLDVNKIDGDKKPLEGAGFTLYKKINGRTDDEGWEEQEVIDADISRTSFTFSGLDAGEYKIVESTVPTGYNKIEDITFTIAATYDEDSADPQLKSLTVTNVKGGSGITNDSFKIEMNTGIISTDIVNQAGAQLPETGGIGTTIFYVLGSILVVGAVILLVTKKRMSAEK